MDLSKATDILIVVENRQHKAEFLEKKPAGTIIFKILERDHPYIKAMTGHRCRVLITMRTEKGAEKFLFEGRISSESIDTATVWSSTAIIPDLRREVRHEIPPVIARLEEKTFLHMNVIDANIINISKSGATIATTVPLHTTTKYKLDSKFHIRHTMKPFSAIFIVGFCMKRRFAYVSGGVFEEQSMLPEHRKTLDEFLMEM